MCEVYRVSVFYHIWTVAANRQTKALASIDLFRFCCLYCSHQSDYFRRHCLTHKFFMNTVCLTHIYFWLRPCKLIRIVQEIQQEQEHMQLSDSIR